MTAYIHIDPNRTVSVTVEGLGTVTLPRAESVTFLTGVGLLVTVGIIEWPLAVAFVLGRLLTRNTRSGALRGFGEALAVGIR